MRGLRLGLSLTGGGAFDPATLFASSEAGAWYDPSDLTTLWKDTAGTTPVTADGDAVARIDDKSGNGNHATQSTSTKRPLYKLDGEGNAYLSFDGTDDFLALPNMVSSWTAGVGIFACKLNADPPAANSKSGPVLGDFGTASQGDNYPFVDGNVYCDFLSTARKTAGNPGDMAEWHVGEFRSASNAWAAAFNGTDYFTASSNTVAGNTTPLIGTTGTGVVLFFGFVGRIILIDRVPTAAELTNARAWVGSGLGL